MSLSCAEAGLQIIHARTEPNAARETAWGRIPGPACVSFSDLFDHGVILPRRSSRPAHAVFTPPSCCEPLRKNSSSCDCTGRLPWLARMTSFTLYDWFMSGQSGNVARNGSQTALSLARSPQNVLVTWRIKPFCRTPMEISIGRGQGRVLGVFVDWPRARLRVRNFDFWLWFGSRWMGPSDDDGQLLLHLLLLAWLLWQPWLLAACLSSSRWCCPSFLRRSHPYLDRLEGTQLSHAPRKSGSKVAFRRIALTSMIGCMLNGSCWAYLRCHDARG